MDPCFSEYGFQQIPDYIEQNLSVPSFLTMTISCNTSV